MTHRKALLIEDEHIICRGFNKILKAEDFEIDIVSNGLDAKEMINQKDYDLLLSDIRTPKTNGIEFYQYLEQVKPELKSKVIFTTGDVLSNRVQEFLKEVKKTFLAKPFDPDQLKQIIKNMFEGVLQ
jgi:DNA-binding NtrC family response regulator